MKEKTGTGVSSKKEKVEESQSRSVTLSLDTPSGAGLGRYITLRDWDSSTFSFSELTPVPVFSFICTIYVIIKKNSLTYTLYILP